MFSILNASWKTLLQSMLVEGGINVRRIENSQSGVFTYVGGYFCFYLHSLFLWYNDMQLLKDKMHIQNKVMLVVCYSIGGSVINALRHCLEGHGFKP